MISSVPLAWVLTALFTATGGYALARWSEAVSARRPAAHRTAELAHVVMSAAMVLMAWTWPGTAGLWVQLLLFGVFGAFFVGIAARGIPCGPAGPSAGAAHALMAAAMVWMLAAMPVIMPMAVVPSGATGGHAGHAGHGATPGAGHAMHGGQAGWAVAVTVVLGAAVLAVSGYWAARALGRGRRPGDPLTPDDGAPVTATGAATGTAVATRADATAPPSRLGARSDAACHAAMGAGMVVMLAAMVAGW